MKLNVQQTIWIQSIKIGVMTNSSVLQIGTSGMITPFSHLYNTGKFNAPAPPIPTVTTEKKVTDTAAEQSILVPLS